jgi:hypothetical protein
MGRYILLDPWVPIPQACLYEDGLWYDDAKYNKAKTWSVELGPAAERSIRRDYFHKAKRKGAYRLGPAGVKSVKDLLKDGEIVELAYECDKCKQQFSRGGLTQWHYDLDIDINGNLSPDNKCPTKEYTWCDGTLTKLWPRQKKRMKIPKEYEGLVFKREGNNLGVEAYGQDSILIEGWDKENSTLKVEAYMCSKDKNCKFNNTVKAETYWKEHVNKMRTYSWGRIEHENNWKTKTVFDKGPAVKLWKNQILWRREAVGGRVKTGDRTTTKGYEVVYKECKRCNQVSHLNATDCQWNCGAKFTDDGSLKW